MAQVIGRAGAKLNIRLGQSPEYKDPQLDTDLQQMYNALHLLSQYMDILRENLESAPGQNPAESIRFRRTFWAPARQNIVQGAIVSSWDHGIVNGVLTTQGTSTIVDGAVSIGSTGTRELIGLIQQQAMVALTDATAGQLVQVGVGPGVTQITGAKCGQLVWASDARYVSSYRQANESSTQYVYARELTGNGGIYLSNPLGRWVSASGFGYNWEGYWRAGFPYNSGGTYYYSRAFLYPVAVCISDGFVLFTDFKRSDSPPHTFG